MKKLSIFLVLIAFVFASCNNDLDLEAPSKDIPVVYGVWSKLNNDHYLRIEKGFINPTTDAPTLAQDPANFTYENLTVTIERNGVFTELEKVNGDDEGIVRDTGFFQNSPNILYKLGDYGLARNDVINLKIDRGQGYDEVTSRTKILNDFELKTPNPQLTQAGELRGVDIRPTRAFNVVTNAGDDAKIFDVNVIFHYDEIINNVTEQKQYKWVVAKSDYDPIRSNQAVQFEADGTDFFRRLKENIPEQLGVVRRFRKYSVEIVAGGEELKDYARLTQANTGITSSQEVPIFEGSINGGLGIFSSKFRVYVDSLPIKDESYNEIKTNELTSNLGFQ